MIHTRAALNKLGTADLLQKGMRAENTLTDVNTRALK
jgi:hypothetical protein